MDEIDLSDTALSIASAWVQAFNQANWETFKAHLHPEIVFTQRTHNTVDKGLEEVFASFHDWRAVHTNLHGQVVGGFGNGDCAALEVRWTGMKRDEVVDFYACLLFKTMEGKVVEITDYY